MELDVLKPEAKTEVGSYFVANYPPFSIWSRDHVATALRTLETPAAQQSNPGAPGQNPKSKIVGPDAPLGLYLHIPFCRKRCKFCYFRVYTDKNASEVDVYMDALAREVAMYKDKPRLAGRQFEFVYFGGGTPSFLSNDQLKRLIDRINQHWRWDAAREVTFECEPGTLKRSKLETIKSIGVTRLSLGIEHWDDEILERNGRAHRSKEIGIAYQWAREVGFPQINVDLIAGMVGDDDDKWKLAVEKTVALQPDSVTIYQMELPFNTVFSKEARERGEQLVADWPTKRRWVAYAFEQFEKEGYAVSSGYTLVRKMEASRPRLASAKSQTSQPGATGLQGAFVYRDALWHGGDMVGTGVASFSHVGGVHFQNEDMWENYLARLDAGELPLSRALPLTPHQSLIRELILQLKLGRIHAGYFRDKFGVEIQREFSEAWLSLKIGGFLDVQENQIELTRAGLLRVDALLPRFFEPEHRGIRYT